MELLGIGSRVKHPAYGDGAVIRLHVAAYEVCFMQFGVKMVPKDYNNWQVVEALPAEEAVTFTEAEKGLTRILRAWSGFNPELTPLGDRWNKGKLVMHSNDAGLQPKEVPIETPVSPETMVPKPQSDSERTATVGNFGLR